MDSSNDSESKRLEIEIEDFCFIEDSSPNKNINNDSLSSEDTEEQEALPDKDLVYKAIECGNEAELKLFKSVKGIEDIVAQCQYKGYTALQLAILSGSVKCVEFVLDLIPNQMKEVDGYGRTALHYAVRDKLFLFK